MALTRTNLVGAISVDGHGTSDFTTSSFTPPDNSLLVVSGGAMDVIGATGLDLALTMAGGGLTFTRRVNIEAGAAAAFSIATVIWTAPVTTGASMTLSLGAGARNKQFAVISAVAYTGYDTGTPIGGTGTVVDTASPDGAQAITLSAAPTAADEAFGAITIDKDAAATTPGATFTEIHDLQAGGSGGLESEIRTGSTSTTVDWVDTLPGAGSIFKCCAAALVVNAGAGGGAPDPGWLSAGAPFLGSAPNLIPGLPQLLDPLSVGDTGTAVVEAEVNPDLIFVPTLRLRWPLRRWPRSAQPAPPQVDVPQVAVRNARPMLRRDASRTAGPVPDQVTVPATPPIPGIATHRQRWARRRSESAQPVPAQDVAPTNPPLALLTRARRVLFGRRLSDTTDPLFEQPTPPAQAHPRRPVPRLRTSSTAAPAADQPAVSAPLERRRLAVRRRSGRSATPTPTQQTAPLNPDFVLLNRQRLRRLVRRGAGRTATPTPAQQAAPSNPEIVSAVHALRRRLFRRGHGRTAAPIPAQQAAVQNSDLVQLTRQHVRRVARRGSGRTAAPIPTQAAPVTPAFVPAALRRPRRVLRIHSRVASPPPEQLAPVQSSPASLRALLRRARRRIAQVFPFVAPPTGRFIDVDITTGSDHYRITTGSDRYSITSGSDRYKINTGSDRYQAGTGGDRYSVEV